MNHVFLILHRSGFVTEQKVKHPDDDKPVAHAWWNKQRQCWMVPKGEGLKGYKCFKEAADSEHEADEDAAHHEGEADVEDEGDNE